MKSMSRRGEARVQHRRDELLRLEMPGVEFDLSIGEALDLANRLTNAVAQARGGQQEYPALHSRPTAGAREALQRVHTAAKAARPLRAATEPDNSVYADRKDQDQ